MAVSRSRRFWQISRRVFRWFRIFVFFFIFLAVFAAVYLHEIGVPGFIKGPVLDRIHQHGVDVQFSNIRWQWPGSIVVNDAVFALTNQTASPKFSSSKAELHFDIPWSQPKKWTLSGVTVAAGNLYWPV